MLYVPHILIQFRYTGAVSSLFVSSALGTILVYMYSSAMARYPGKGLPEVLSLHCPRWIVTISMLFFTLMWLFATSIVIVAYAILINRFFNPDVNATVILVMLIIACAYAATRSTLTVLLMLEIGILLNAPIILFVLFKAVRSPQLNWDSSYGCSS